MSTVHYSSQNQTWCTPQDLFEELHQEFNFQLDPAATDQITKCEIYYTPETDGLSNPWSVDEGRGVFCNPPYGRAIKDWVKKAYIESQGGTTIVLLIPARTDTTYFHEFIYGKAEIRFLRGRLKFTDDYGNPSKNSAPFPSMVVIYNP